MQQNRWKNRLSFVAVAHFGAAHSAAVVEVFEIADFVVAVLEAEALKGESSEVAIFVVGALVGTAFVKAGSAIAVSVTVLQDAVILDIAEVIIAVTSSPHRLC